MTKISIIVPVFNSKATVEASLQSLFDQSLKEIEVIAVNDASTDESGARLDRIASQHPQLKVIHLKQNGGVHEARAAGLRAASAPWIGFMDADDFAKPQMFELLLEACVRDDADIAICGVDAVNSARQFLYPKVRFSGKAPAENEIFSQFCRMEFGTCALWNKLYKREIITRYGLTKWRWRQDASEDTLVNIGCFMAASRISLLQQSLYEYVIHECSATQAADAAVSYCRMLRAYAIAIDYYGHHGSRVIDAITQLYSIQIAYPCYRATTATDLAPHEKGLIEAIKLLAEQHPMGLATLVNRPYVIHRVPESLRTIFYDTSRSIRRLLKFAIHSLANRRKAP
jgi:glycosyltransferase involved in cell wall biosynthesis